MILSPSSFPNRTGRGVRIAVVDSGVHADHPHVGGVSGGIAIGPGGELSDDYVDRLGHGTAVAAAIREKAPDCELIAVRVFDRTLMTTGQALVAAIEWSALQGVQIINLSLGTSNQEHGPALTAAVAKAATHGAIVVSAAPQEDAAWLPGGLAGVVAVDVDWDCPRDECRVITADADSIRLSASGYPRPIPGVPPERNFSGVSFAVANMTGVLALLAEDKPTYSIIAVAEGLLLHSDVPLTALSSGDDGTMASMPVVSTFFGIVIRMHYREHEPRHFHAEYHAQSGKFDFDGVQMVGNIGSRNALRLIRQWAVLNRAALDANWSKIKASEPLNRIPPLE